MYGVLIGCTVIAVVVAIGYLLARLNVVGDEAATALNRVAFFVATPAVTFLVLADSDLHLVLSSYMLVAGVSAAVGVIVFVVASRLFFRSSMGTTTVGAAAAVFLNCNNMGLPVAIYVLEDPTAIAAVLLLQPLLLSPALIGLLDYSTLGRPTAVSLLTQPLRNPVLLAAAAGLLVAITGVQVPTVIQSPIELMAGAAVATVLLAFGISLRGRRVLNSVADRRAVVVATIVKTIVMPTAALLAALALQLPREQVFAMTVVAALPTGQMIYNYASRFGVATELARDTVTLTTVGAVPVLIVLAALLA